MIPEPSAASIGRPGAREKNVASWRASVSGRFDTSGPSKHPRSVFRVLRGLIALVSVLAVMQGTLGQCLGWQATPEARRRCCESGACGRHSHADDVSRTAVSQSAADDCCAQSPRRESNPSGKAFASTITLTVLTSVPPVALNGAPTIGPRAAWETPSPPPHVPRHLLLSVLLV